LIEDEGLLQRFAAINRQPGDVRLSALVLGSDIDKRTFPAADSPGSPSGVNRHTYDLQILSAYHAHLTRWLTTWKPTVVSDRADDPAGLWLAFLVARFRQVATYSRFINRWLADYRAAGIEPHRVHTALSDDQWAILQKAVETSEEVLFSLSMESRTMSNEERRAVQWARGPDGSPPHTARFTPLTPDPDQVKILATCIDTVINVVIPFPALFLASHAGRVRSFTRDD
jgi:hypothetical protein